MRVKHIITSIICSSAMLFSSHAISNASNHFEQNISAKCPSCLEVAKHVQQYISEQSLQLIIEHNEAYIFRLALEQNCKACYEILTTKENQEKRLLNIEETKRYLQSDEAIKLFVANEFEIKETTL